MAGTSPAMTKEGCLNSVEGKVQVVLFLGQVELEAMLQ
jgi:hypothetical protein